MGFNFASDQAGRSRLVVTDEPGYIVPLQIAPPSLEQSLKQGKWLVVSMSVWRTQDVQAGQDAIQVVKRKGGLVRLGLRPFDYPEENATWVPELGERQAGDQLDILMEECNGTRALTIQGKTENSPIWVALSEGKVMSVRHGQLTEAETEELIGRLLFEGR